MRRVLPTLVYLLGTVPRHQRGPGRDALAPRERQNLDPAIASRMVRMPRSGIHLSARTIEKVKALLLTTDLSMAEIAKRIDCSKSAVASINNKYRIRIYGKKRNSWTLNIPG
jgi:hypothetical protein